MTPKGDLSVVSPLEGHASVFLRQQALVAAISEKDANIALLELSSNKRKKAQEEVMALKREKDRLMHQLKQQTQSRMKLISENYEEDHHHPHPHPQPHHPHYQHPQHPQHPQHHPHQHHQHHPHQVHQHHRSLPRGPPHANHRPPVDQDDEEGIWHDRHLPVRRRWLHFH
ncbi:ERC protein 2-like [Gadus macrocephalus]|uniref:ERC protein 2-like n=1 Tax=Gadus macrocephalus TaxID=80720 RepID=UPI0028CB9BFD|nr:ERC protein 2-like [Gadus macrocephalus]